MFFVAVRSLSLGAAPFFFLLFVRFLLECTLAARLRALAVCLAFGVAIWRAGVRPLPL